MSTVLNSRIVSLSGLIWIGDPQLFPTRLKEDREGFINDLHFDQKRRLLYEFYFEDERTQVNNSKKGAGVCLVRRTDLTFPSVHNISLIKTHRGYPAQLTMDLL